MTSETKQLRFRRFLKRAWRSNASYKVRLTFFRIADYFAGPSLERARFKRVHGYPLKLKNPESFNEKIFWKMHFDRNPLLPIVADKVRVRKYVERVLGEERAAEILIPVYCVTDSPQTIPFESLPRSFALKANHSCGMNYLVFDKAQEDKKKLIKICERWLRRSYGDFEHQWAYESIPRRILVEKLLVNERGGLMVPYDYKFFMFHGVCRLIHVIIDRFGARRSNLYDSDWNPIDYRIAYPPGDPCPRPKSLEKMLGLAEELAQDFDFIRVDMYESEGRVYFGELTNYPSAGMIRFIPSIFDYEFGNHWRLEERYWENNPRTQDLSIYEV